MHSHTWSSVSHRSRLNSPVDQAVTSQTLPQLYRRMPWAVAIGAVLAVPYIRCNKALRRLKEARGWRRTEDAPVR